MKFNRGLIFLVAMTIALTASAQSSSTRAAVVKGEVITEDQVARAAAGDLQKLEANRPQLQAAYAKEKLQLMWKALDSIIEDKVLAAEAAELKMTKEQLLDAEVESNIPTPSPADVDAFYEANKAQIPTPKAQALPQVRQFMIDQRRRQLRQPLIQRLKQKYGVTTYLDPVRAEIATAGHPSRGPANAPVTIVEFADFECPFCGGLFPQLKLIEESYAGKLRVVYRQFPLTNIHSHAQKAAEASLCANEQQRFWEYHDSLFRNQQDLTVEALKRRASDLKLDTAAFNTCLDSGKQADAIRREKAEGSQLGVGGTPTVFINGRLLTGAPSYASIKAIIDDELQRASAR
jgi:protein-disulfide isomerase